jgi:ElaB/YqjD/DUF883 family membrane-anchored ribosome-binding protein
MLTRAQLKQLAGQASDGPVTSLYLRIDGSRYIRQGYQARLKDLLRQQRQALRGRNLTPRQQESVQQDFQKILAYVGTDLDRSGTKTIAIFSSSRSGLWLVVRLPVSLASLLTVRRVPYITPLALVLEDQRAYGTILVDRAKARLFHILLGQPEEVIDLEREVGGERQQVHLSRAEKRLDRHEIELEHQHYRAVAARAQEYFHLHPCVGIVLGGHQGILPVFEGFLPTDLAAAIVERIAIEPDAPLDVAAKRALEVKQRVERRRKEGLVGELEERLAHKAGLAVAGLKETLQALQLGQIGVLLIREGQAASGSQCRECGALLPPSQRCGVCGQPTDALPDLVGELIARAFQQGASIEEIHSGTALDRHGKIAALLRFRL